MTNGPPAVPGPLRRQANYVIALFILVHVGLVLRATLPLPGKLHGPWPWRMFERRGSWERTLKATGIDRSGERHELPLHRIFGYARGMTRMYAYHQLDALGEPSERAAQSAFAAFLARRASELGMDLSTIELGWISTNLDTGQIDEYAIGSFHVGPGP